MKPTLPILFIAFASAKAAAFQTQVDTTKLALQPDIKVKPAEANAARALNITTVHPRLWSGIPVTGCHCPFCTQMRDLAG